MAGRKKKGELATMSLEFEYLHRKSRCEMLVGGSDNISNDGITLDETFWNNKVICIAEKPLFKKNLVKKAIIKLKLVL